MSDSEGSQGPTTPLRIEIAEAFTRFRCNEKGCCCSGWSIPWPANEFGAVVRRLPPEEAAEFAQACTYRGTDGEVSTAYPHGQPENNDEKVCYFLTEDAACGLQRRFGLEALPRLCRAFPAHGELVGDRASIQFDATCPEVLERLADPGGYELITIDGASHPEVASRYESPFNAPPMTIGGVLLSWSQAYMVRQCILTAFAEIDAPVLHILAWVNFAIVRLAEGAPPEAFAVVPDEPVDSFYGFFDDTVSAHSAGFLTDVVRAYRRFIHAVDIDGLDIALLEPALEYDPEWPSGLEPFDDACVNLVRNYLCHRFAGAYQYRPRRDSLSHSYGTINHTVATALRVAVGLTKWLGRPLDVDILKVAFGVSEYTYRGKSVPPESMPWFGIDETVEDGVGGSP